MLLINYPNATLPFAEEEVHLRYIMYITFLESFRQRYGRQISTVSADSGYGCEMNYGYMVSNQIALFVRYNMFHVEMKA